MKMKANKKGNELKVSDSNTYRLKNEERMKNGQRKVKNGGKSSQICSQKCLGSITEALRHDFSSQKRVFFLSKIAKMHNLGVMKILKHLPPLFIGKKGGACSPEASWGRFLSAPQLLSSPPFSYITEKLRKPNESISDLFSSFFLFPYTNVKWNMLTQGFRKFYGSITEATKALKTIFQQNVEELAAQLLPP